MILSADPLTDATERPLCAATTAESPRPEAAQADIASRAVVELSPSVTNRQGLT